MDKRSLFFLFLGVLCLMSCDETRVYDDYRSLPGEWHRDSLVQFKFNAPDTVKPYNLFLNVRNNFNYDFSNIYLITELNFPNGKVISDTLQYQMAAPSGEWLGTGFGDVKESKLWYKEQIKFTEEGEYMVTVQQAMRKRDSIHGITSLEGITEVGFRIEDIKQQE
ncbi:gliding motility lipoprotein GldH [Salinimicrobium oceani]|uniref:Gliding motility lipoprotein GldH n=1 Tax=Salinimicrobium oceani TaxID=2722702 RepID=A0ABX1CVU0_9FLAO|nr:gliding motility lipoprotein GldH [Salinimicrobium oceani]NJW52035.1 gliding motility lipoprotein GldH [Salinimicrobium oceani]